MARVRPVLALIAVLAGEAGAVAGLWRLGDRSWAAIDVADWSRWLAATPSGDALAAVLRLVALAVALHLLCSTAAYVVARCSGLPAAVRAVRWVTLPVVRRMVDRAVAVALTAGTALGGPGVGLAVASQSRVAVVAPAGPAPAGATTPLLPSGPAPLPAPQAAPPVGAAQPLTVAAPVPELAAWVPGLLRADYVAAAQAPATSTVAGPSPGRPDAPSAATTRGADTSAVVAVVESGDNLWALSAARVASVTGRAVTDLTDREVHAYWVTVLAANRDRLPPSSPDLVHPGDHVTLPPLGA